MLPSAVVGALGAGTVGTVERNVQKNFFGGGGGVLQVGGQYLRAQGNQGGRSAGRSQFGQGDDLEEDPAPAAGAPGVASSPDDGAVGDGEREQSKRAAATAEKQASQRDLFRSYHQAATSEDDDFQ